MKQSIATNSGNNCIFKIIKISAIFAMITIVTVVIIVAVVTKPAIAAVVITDSIADLDERFLAKIAVENNRLPVLVEEIRWAGGFWWR